MSEINNIGHSIVIVGMPAIWLYGVIHGYFIEGWVAAGMVLSWVLVMSTWLIPAKGD